jgi:hypothetical protein
MDATLQGIGECLTLYEELSSILHNYLKALQQPLSLTLNTPCVVEILFYLGTSHCT